MPDITAARPTSGTPIETAWGDQVHDMLEGLQTGIGQGTIPTSTFVVQIPVVFPRAYAAPPNVFLALTLSSDQYMVTAAAAITTTGFTIRCRTISGSNPGSAVLMVVNWLAIGTPA